MLITIALSWMVLLTLPGPLAAGLRWGGGGGLPLAMAWLAASCLTAIDGTAVEDLLKGLGQSISGRLTHLLQFEAALSTLMSLLSFGFIAGLFHIQSHSSHLDLHTEVALTMPDQLLVVGRFVLAGLMSGAVVGALAPPLIDRMVRSDANLLLVAIALAFVAYGLGQLLGGGGMLAVFSTGVWLSNGRYHRRRFDQNSLHRALHPFNTAADVSVLLLLGLSVAPENLLQALPLGVLLALALPLARLLAVALALPGGSFRPQERLLVTCCGVRGAVPLGLALALVEELPHLPGLSGAMVEPLGANLEALIFLVVLLNLLLQTGVIRAFGHALAPHPATGIETTSP